ncbi:hypothetical protein KW794_01185, partial [Candidatus Saccharibacteria bacterium]|nr:hypothetical protein [Candidatus Saccharibacteria bacterium]
MLEIYNPERPEIYRGEAAEVAKQDAIDIAADFIEATGGKMPTYEQLEAIHVEGLINLTPDKIFNVFNGIDDLHTLAEEKYQLNIQHRAMQEEEMLAEIDSKLDTGDLPTELFAYSPRDLTPEQKISVYGRYLVVRNLSQTQDRIRWDSERILSIARGYRIEGGQSVKLISSFSAEIGKGFTTDPDYVKHLEVAVDMYASQIDLYSYVFPTLRQSHLSKLRKISEPKKIETQYYLDAVSRQVLIGKAAVQNYLDSGGHPADIKEFDPRMRLLIDNDRNISQLKIERDRFKDWGERDYLQYGEDLRDLFQALGRPLDRTALRRASRLGIGPGVKSIIKHTNSKNTYEYFMKLGFNNRRPKRQFESMQFEDYVELAKQIAQETENGKVTKEIVRQRIAGGYEEPSPT